MDILHALVSFIVLTVITVLAITAWVCMACIYVLDAFLTWKDNK